MKWTKIKWNELKWNEIKNQTTPGTLGQLTGGQGGHRAPQSVTIVPTIEPLTFRRFPKLDAPISTRLSQLCNTLAGGFLWWEPNTCDLQCTMCAFFVATRWGHSACSRPAAHTGPECLHPPPTKRTPQARHRLCPIACPVAPAALMHMLFLRALHPIQHESHKGREGSVPPNSLCVLAPGALTPKHPCPQMLAPQDDSGDLSFLSRTLTRAGEPPHSPGSPCGPGSLAVLITWSTTCLVPWSPLHEGGVSSLYPPSEPGHSHTAVPSTFTDNEGPGDSSPKSEPLELGRGDGRTVRRERQPKEVPAVGVTKDYTPRA